MVPSNCFVCSSFLRHTTLLRTTRYRNRGREISRGRQCRTALDHRNRLGTENTKPGGLGAPRRRLLVRMQRELRLGTSCGEGGPAELAAVRCGFPATQTRRSIATPRLQEMARRRGGKGERMQGRVGIAKTRKHHQAGDYRQRATNDNPSARTPAATKLPRGFCSPYFIRC